ncbi:MAG: hypothetical protein GW941_01045 [Candidatus Pacebacteria bacterium]|nr:hypothetical protein [Candidatus Paceibacterota bacterium]
MDDIFGKSKNFWLSLVALFIILFLVSFIVLPKIFFLLITNSKSTSFSEVDYHSSLQFILADDGKLIEIENIFSDVITKDDFHKINVIITDMPQKNQINWIDEHGQTINHLGYDAFREGENLSIYIYNNTAAISRRGWDVEKIARENEIILLKGLLYYRGWPIEKVNEEAKKIYLSLYERYPNQLFLMTYDF